MMSKQTQTRRWALTLTAGLAVLVPGLSQACEKHAQAAAQQAPAAATVPVKAAAPAATLSAKAAAPAATVPAKPAPPAGAPAPGAARGVEPAQSPRSRLMRDSAPQLHADKCSCSSAADCTCKKGKCDCNKCKKPKRQVVEALRGRRESPVAPRGTARDAAAGLGV